MSVVDEVIAAADKGRTLRTMSMFERTIVRIMRSNLSPKDAAEVVATEARGIVYMARMDEAAALALEATKRRTAAILAREDASFAYADAREMRAAIIACGFDSGEDGAF